MACLTSWKRTGPKFSFPELREDPTISFLIFVHEGWVLLRQHSTTTRRDTEKTSNSQKMSNFLKKDDVSSPRRPEFVKKKKNLLEKRRRILPTKTRICKNKSNCVTFSFISANIPQTSPTFPYFPLTSYP